MKIVLMRHGRPQMPLLEKINASAFVQWVDDYNQATLCASSMPSLLARQCAQNAKVLVCSDLKRSRASAELLNSERIVLADAIFNEADLPVAHWQSLRLSPKTWAIVFRVLWFLGYAKNCQSVMKTGQRAQVAAEKLIAMTEVHGDVLFVGHGVFNRFLAKRLRKAGWQGAKNPGVGHWAFSVYER